MAEAIGIDFIDIVNIVGDSKRPLIEGQAILDANHVIMCGVVSANKNRAELEALCLQTSYLKGVPHKIRLQIEIDQEKNISCSCTCKAGNSGKCKHIIGTLLYVFRHTIKNLEDLSSTDLAQQWGKLKNENHLYNTAVPIDQFCHMGKKSSNKKPKIALESRLGRSADEDTLEILLSGAQESELHQTLKNETISPLLETYYNNNLLQLSLCHSIIGNNQLLIYFDQILSKNIELNEAVAQFYIDNVVIEYSECIQLCLSTLSQSGDVWHNARKLRITGTSCYNFFTYDRNKNPDWFSKIQGLHNSVFNNSAIAHGKKYEPEALEAYEAVTGHKVERLGFLVVPYAPWLGVSLDGIVSSKCCVEAKCPLAGKTKTCSEVCKSLKYLSGSLENNNLSLKHNHIYYGQVQLQMLLSGLDICHFIIFCPYDCSIIILEIPLDRKFLEEMLSVLHYVYFYNILPILYDMYK